MKSTGNFMFVVILPRTNNGFCYILNKNQVFECKFLLASLQIGLDGWSSYRSIVASLKLFLTMSAFQC